MIFTESCIFFSFFSNISLERLILQHKMDSKVDETPLVSVKEENVKLEGPDGSKPDDVEMEEDMGKPNELQQKIIRQIEVMTEKKVNILQWMQFLIVCLLSSITLVITTCPKTNS